jgi:hypothetical protein
MAVANKPYLNMDSGQPMPPMNDTLTPNIKWGQHLMALNQQSNSSPSAPSTAGAIKLNPQELQEARANAARTLSPQELQEARTNARVNVAPSGVENNVVYQIQQTPKSIVGGIAEAGQAIAKLAANFDKAHSNNPNTLAYLLKTSPQDVKSLSQVNKGINYNIPYHMDLSQDPIQAGLVQPLARYGAGAALGTLLGGGAGAAAGFGIEEGANALTGAALDPNHPISGALWNMIPDMAVRGAHGAIGLGTGLKAEKSGLKVNQLSDEINLNNTTKQNALQELEMQRQPVSTTASEGLADSIKAASPALYQHEESAITGGNKSVGQMISDKFNTAQEDVKTAQKLANRNLNMPIPEDFGEGTFNNDITNDIAMYDMDKESKPNDAVNLLPEKMKTHVFNSLNPEGQELTEPGIRTNAGIIPISKITTDPVRQQRILASSDPSSVVNPELPGSSSINDVVNSLPDKQSQAQAIKILKSSGMIKLNKNKAMFASLPKATQEFLGKNTFMGATKADFMKAQTAGDFQQIVQNLNEQNRNPNLANAPFQTIRNASTQIQEGSVHPILKNLDAKLGTRSSDALRIRNGIVSQVTSPFEATKAAKAVANGAMKDAPVSKIRDALASAQKKLSRFKNVPGKNISAPLVGEDHYISKYSLLWINCQNGIHLVWQKL